MNNFKDRDMQLVIGWILRIGVVVSMCIVLIGGIIYLYRHGHSTPQYHVFNGAPPFVQNTPGIINGILTFKGQAIIQLGILLLIITPILRVVFSIFGFLLERDYLFTFITLIVLGIILVSMLSGHAG